MSSVHRILTGLEFVVDPVTDHVQWPAETEDLVRLSIELARVTRSGLAFAAVGAAPPEGDIDCGQVDRWLATAEQNVEEFWRPAVSGEFQIEDSAWLGNPSEEWVASARESEMDLLVVPGLDTSESSADRGVELQWPGQAGCPVWFAGREPDQLASEPPLIVFCDDLSDAAATHLPFAVELALAWNARLMIVHPLSRPVSDLASGEEDQLRREIFVRLSRTDFRAINNGSQLRFVAGGLEEILAAVTVEQSPNLLLSSAGSVAHARPQWRGHLLLWSSKSPSDAESGFESLHRQNPPP